ncbi:hypothetical protein VHEMI06444 [[Torrubiella] hemipterigena]|uniref:NAD-dependent epimerase/dehydratase domain-containing protein n=1 Tax=[Torrubiella] hemipterigena TaxID=1531966 RepID=A0A0A1TL61_9HYPO|nr:hypothetical protein VHEMI06444 [[Torrubiella] hemipterigena]
MSKIFITGASGYIGGQALYQITQDFPNAQITLLERLQEEADKIQLQYRSVKLVIAGLDDAAIIEHEAEQADIVLNLADAKHIAGAQSIHNGLKRRSVNSPVFWVQISGAALLATAETANKEYQPGSSSETVFDDTDGIAALRDHIRQYPGRAIDNYLQSVSSTSPHVHSALLTPPIIYGKGDGPVNQRSTQVPELISATLKRGKALQLGNGLNKWGNIHIRDLGTLISGFVDKAIGKDLSKDIWGDNGVYLASVGELSFGEIAQKIALAAKEQSYIGDTSVDSLVAADFQTEGKGFIPLLFGTNARSRSHRATKYLDWKPTSHNLEQEIKQCVAREAEALGLQKLATV